MVGEQAQPQASIVAGDIAVGDLVLRPVSPALALALVAGDFSEVQVGEGWPHEDTVDGLGMVAQGRSLGWLVTLDDVVVGECGTHASADPTGIVEIGYGLAAPYRGRGFGRQTVRALAHWLLGQPGITGVIAHTDPGNEPSRRSLVSAGFRYDGEEDGECLYTLYTLGTA
jgi:RimJ/RimL family protein N-acetyltransferase